MPNTSWTPNDPDNDLDPISSLLSEWSDPEEEEEEFRGDFFQGLEGRRRKAAFVLMMIWAIVIGIHSVTWGIWMIMGFSGVVLLQSLRLVSAKPEETCPPLEGEALANAPFVSLLAAAKNEETVITRLVSQLCHLNYPENRYEVWIVDDHSTDKTPEILDNLVQEYPQLRVIHRPANAGGGKSGALNEVLTLTKGDIIGVFDADAKVSEDLLLRVVPMFQSEEMGALQVRKAIANEGVNFWTQGQQVEMALDSYFQQQRIATRGIGELRGNGQFVRRSALESCGGWNEQTITDDLDLTIRLHLDNWKIGILADTAVEEEGVTTAIALWHQRNRWAEGGYQRYLDYWKYILNTPMGFRKKLDLIFFMLIQYLMPTAAIPDLIMSLIRHRLPLLGSVSGIVLSMSCWGMYRGLRRIRKGEELSFPELMAIAWQTLRGTLYMMHWFIIIPSVTLRMSIRPKRLKWVKTVHEGEETGEEVSSLTS